MYGLTSQIRRSCAAIPTNADLARFLQIALGSASELEYHLLLACNLAFLKDPEHERLTKEITEIKRMLTSFIKSLRAFGNRPDLKAET